MNSKGGIRREEELTERGTKKGIRESWQVGGVESCRYTTWNTSAASNWLKTDVL